MGKLPPGPKGIPCLGNLFQLSLMPWKEFEVWKKQYATSTHSSVVFDPDSFSMQDPWCTLQWPARESSSSTRIKLQLTYWTAEDTSIAIDLVWSAHKCGCYHQHSVSHIYMTFNERDTLQRDADGFARLRRHVHPVPFSWSFLDN